MTRVEAGSEFDLTRGGIDVVCPWCSTLATVNNLYRPHVAPMPFGKVLFLPGECNSCGSWICIEAEHQFVDNVKITRLHPPPCPTSLGAAPDSVKAALQEAQACEAVGAPFAGALVCRRAIQLIAREHNAKGRDLKAEIDALPIPEPLKNVAHAVRIVANDAAHPDPLDWESLTTKDLRDLRDLAEQIVHYLYELPAQVAALHGRLAAQPPDV